MIAFFRHGRTIAFLLVLGIVIALVASARLLTDTAELRYDRDVYRMVYNDNLSLLENLHAKLGLQGDSLQKLIDRPARDPNAPYIVVSIADHRLWYKQGQQILFTAPVATASGKELVGGSNSEHWRFETPRGRLVVQSKDENPVWIPPEWYYVEQAHKRGLGLIHVERGQTISGKGGVTYTASGTNVVKQSPDGHAEALPSPKEGHEMTVNGNILVPPFGTVQRRYLGTLGTRRLDLGDGYGIHGTDDPESIGHSVSHGCVRLHNEDVQTLYPMVPVGTPVYIY
jgi:lipoprotein-anchoring transpeptidase ErfK/SrfK